MLVGGMVVLTIHPRVYSYEKPLPEGTPFVIRGEEGIIEDTLTDRTENSLRTHMPTKVISTEVAFVDYDYTAYGNSCILGLAGIGYPVDKFNAVDLQSNATFGEQDDLVLFKYGSGIDKSHVACISANLAGAYEVWECNKTRGVCGNRIVQKDDNQIRGYIRNPNFKGLCSISKIN